MQTPINEGQLLLIPPTGAPFSIPFTLAVGMKPAGLIDGMTNFYADGMALSSTNNTGQTVFTWQGATVSGLLTAGNYTIQYDPAFNIPSAKWSPWDASIQGGSSVFISAAVINAAPPSTQPTILVDTEAIASAINSAVGFAAAQTQAIGAAGRVAVRDLNARLYRYRTGSTGTTEQQIGTVGVSVPVSRDVIEYDRQGRPVISDAAGNEPIGLGGSPTLTLFGNVDYGSADQSDVGRARGFDGNTYAGTVGLECALGRGLALGIGGTYLENNTYLNGGLGTIDIDGFAISTYFSWVGKNCYADVLYSFGIYDNDFRRNTLLGDVATGDAQGTSHTVAFNTGYNFQTGALTTGPIAGLDYSTGNLDAYSETGSPRGAVRVGAQSFDSLLLKIGWQASYRIKSSFATMTPQIRASWEHEFNDGNNSVSAQLINSPFVIINNGVAGAGPRFTTSGNTSTAGSDYLALGAGCLFEFSDRFSVVVDFETHLARQNRNDSFGSIRGTFSF